jgi:hypothetical protein
MIRILSGVLAAVTAILFFGAQAGAQEVDLSKSPVFKVGDQFIEKATILTSKKTETADGKILEKMDEKEDYSTIFEVLSVDDAGKPREVRRTIVNAGQTFKIDTPQTVQKEVAISEIVGNLKKAGLKFAGDTTTIASPKVKELTASQIAVVKDLFSDSISLDGYSESDALLLPSKPIAVGGSWEADRDKLDKWVQASPSVKKMNVKAKSAKFKLVSVTDGIAGINGVVEISATIAGRPIDMNVRLTDQIDTKTGIWRAKGYEMTMEISIEKITVKVTVNSAKTIEYKAGSGKASEAPAGMNKLGWETPGKDENSFKDAVRGVSLDVPKDYETEKFDPKTNLQKFTSPKNKSAAINVISLPTLVDVEELVPNILKSLKTMEDYELVSKEAVTLPGNIPGELLTMTFIQKTITLLSLYVVDGKRLVSVKLTAPTDEADSVAEIKKIAKSLRVFEPDYSKAP